MKEEWMVQPEGSFVPRSTIIIVTFDQGELVASFMDQCFFCLSSKPFRRSRNSDIRLPTNLREGEHLNMHI